MNILKKVVKVLKDPRKIGIFLLNKQCISCLFTDKIFLKAKFRLAMRKKLNLDNPQTFNEKLQWLKLYNCRDEYTMMADKYAVRQYIANKIGEEYLIPLLGVWDRAEDIDFDKLPDQFVLKCNHNSGKGMCICKDKSKLDIAKVRRELNEGLKENYFCSSREWCYKNIKPRIIAEKFIDDGESGLTDYKFLCFDGKVKSCFTCTERFTGTGLKVTFFNENWEKMPFERHYPVSDKDIPEPSCFDEMIMLAEKLSKDMPFVRIDFYEHKGKVLFGEITFYPGGGLEEFTPEKWDYTFGSWITLPEKKVEK